MRIEEAKKYILTNYFDGMANVKSIVGGDEETIAMKLAVEALEKQMPKKPIKDEYHHTCCPNCKWLVMEQTGWGERYLPCCENCGQAIDWSDEAIGWSDEI